jgi:uncharacterized protein YcaQ
MAVPLSRLRRYVVAAQGFATRFRRAGLDDVEAAIGRLSAVQLDSISTVERAHRLTLGARVGAYPHEAITELLAGGRIFEYWAHEACLLPVELYPHFRHTMVGDGHWGFHRHAMREHAELVEPMLARIRDEGPLASRDFDGKGGGGMWNWKPAKMVLEALWDRGDLAIVSRRNFQRHYDLAERVIPEAIRSAPAPDEAQTLRELAVRAVETRGALTEAAIREHWRWKGGRARLHGHLESLVAEGRLDAVQVDDGGPPFYVPAGAEIDGAPTAAVLLSPFDNLVWDRPLLQRLFGFQHVIEVYKREHERVYGYYVLPFLWRDKLVGRTDLKNDRAEGVLRVKALHLEPGVRRSAALETAFDKALARLARLVGAEAVAR